MRVARTSNLCIALGNPPKSTKFHPLSHIISFRPESISIHVRIHLIPLSLLCLIISHDFIMFVYLSDAPFMANSSWVARTKRSCPYQYYSPKLEPRTNYIAWVHHKPQLHHPNNSSNKLLHPPGSWARETVRLFQRSIPYRIRHQHKGMLLQASQTVWLGQRRCRGLASYCC